MNGNPKTTLWDEHLGEEIKAALTQVREGVRESINAANAPKMAATCPYCGAING